tara:strand:- start:13427 stop:15061 length:1635 start_codon:yes stop_codon:yes gene_type:complete
MEEHKQKSHQILNDLYELYSNNEFMYDKLNNYIHNQLPNIFKNIKDQRELKILKLNETKDEKNKFTECFLNTNQYYFIPSTEYFIYYNGLHYQLINEDDLQYNIVRNIHLNNKLINYKRQVKTHIIKKIKDNILYNTIPESETIQFTINMLYPSIFNTKPQVKHFLTLLGDNILKKNNNIIFFISNRSKYFIKSLTQISQMIFGCDMCNNIKYKYHNHNYVDCRLIKINECVKDENIVNSIVSNNILDILSVALHYSKRFESSDEYLINHVNYDTELLDYVFFMKNTTAKELCEIFISQYIDLDETEENKNRLVVDNNNIIRSTQLTWKNMLFLWKKFIDTKQLPSVINHQNIKILLIDQLSKYYNEELESFIGVCSKYMPTIEIFLNFWNKTIISDEMEYDLEIDEIRLLYKQWCELNNHPISNLNDQQLIDLIIHYYPSIEIEKDKFLSNIRCQLWDKQLDISTSISHIKEKIKKKMIEQTNNENMRISIYDIYQSYCKYTVEIKENTKLIVNKNYFDKYMNENYQEYIIDSKFLSGEWCNI